MSKAKSQPTPQYSYKPQKEFSVPSNKPQYYAPAKEPAYNNEKMDKNEVQELKKKVQEINYMMNKRKRSVIKIQKVWRGYLARKRFAKIKGKLIQQKNIRVKQQKKKDYIRKNAKKIICQAIYTYVLKKRNQEKELLKRYVNHCATMIQKTFRGALTRIRYKQMRRRMRRFRILLTAFVLGWKTRRIFKDSNLISLQMDVKDIENLAIDIADNDDPEAVATKEEIPWRLSRAKRQHADRFWKLYFTGSWAEREDSRYKRESSRRGYDNDEPEYYQNKRQQNRDQRGQGNRNRNRKQSDNDEYYEEQPRRNRGYGREPSYGDEEEEHQRNAWDAREDMPIGGKGKYAIPDDDMEEPDVGQERSGKKGRNIPHRDERDDMPITGKGAYNIPDDAGEYPPVETKKRGPARRRDPNAFDAKEDQPVGGKGEYVIPDDLKDEAFQSGGTTEVKKPRREIAKKAKYDPRKAIEEAKKRDEEGGESATKNKKSEAFRDIIRNARKYQQESTGGGAQSDKEQRSESQKPARRGRTVEKKKQIENEDNAKDNEEEGKENADGEGEGEGEGGEKKFRFLKRKTKTIVNEKLNWGKVGSRIDCWVDRSKEAPRSPEREKITITTSVLSRPKTGNPQSHSNQENMKTMNHQERGGHGRTEHPTKGPMVQRVGKNERHEDNVGKESGPVEIKTELKKKKSAPTVKGRGTHPPHRIKIEELEKAYNTNFLNKLNHMTQKFYSESGARDPEENYTSIVPILRLNSAFFFRDDMDQYQEILNQLNEEYQSLQIIN